MPHFPMNIALALQSDEVVTQTLKHMETRSKRSASDSSVTSDDSEDTTLTSSTEGHTTQPSSRDSVSTPVSSQTDASFLEAFDFAVQDLMAETESKHQNQDRLRHSCEMEVFQRFMVHQSLVLAQAQLSADQQVSMAKTPQDFVQETSETLVPKLLRLEDERGCQLLHLAIQTGSGALVKMVLGLITEQDRDLLTSENHAGETPLSLALSSETISDSMLDTLLNECYQPYPISFTQVPLMQSTVSSVLNSLRKLADQDPSMAEKNIDREIQRSRLIANAVYLCQTNPLGNNLLHLAINSNNMDSVTLAAQPLLDLREQSNDPANLANCQALLCAKNSAGQTVLHLAATGKNTSVLSYLIDTLEMPVDLKAPVGSRGSYITPLQCALEKRFGVEPKIITALLDRGADVNVVTAYIEDDQKTVDNRRLVLEAYKRHLMGPEFSQYLLEKDSTSSTSNPSRKSIETPSVAHPRKRLNWSKIHDMIKPIDNSYRDFIRSRLIESSGKTEPLSESSEKEIASQVEKDYQRIEKIIQPLEQSIGSESITSSKDPNPDVTP